MRMTVLHLLVKLNPHTMLLKCGQRRRNKQKRSRNRCLYSYLHYVHIHTLHVKGQRKKVSQQNMLGAVNKQPQ